MIHIENTILLALFIVLILLISVYQRNNNEESFLGRNLETTLDNINGQVMTQIKDEITQSDKIQDVKNRIVELSKQIETLKTNNQSTNTNKLYNTNGVLSS